MDRLKEWPPAPVPEPAKEKYVIMSSGGHADAWTARIVDKINYNWYHVQPVIVEEIGALPVAFGAVRTACNFGESFTEQGVLPAYTYIIMWHIGQFYIFCREP